MRRCYPPPMSSPRDITIRDLRPADEAAAIDLLAEAFIDFPAMQVFAGTDGGARDRLKRTFALEFEPGSEVRALVAEVDGELVGTLTYLDAPSCATMSAGRTLRFLRIAGPRIVRALHMFSRIERVHPRTAHRHLPTIGVRPSRQSEGVGSRLMQAFAARCDQDRLSAYLETVRWHDPGKPSLERFYVRLGYAVSEVLPMADDWSVLTMVRAPAAPVAVDVR